METHPNTKTVINGELWLEEEETKDQSPQACPKNK